MAHQGDGRSHHHCPGDGFPGQPCYRAFIPAGDGDTSRVVLSGYFSYASARSNDNRCTAYCSPHTDATAYCGRDPSSGDAYLHPHPNTDTDGSSHAYLGLLATDLCATFSAYSE